MVMPGKAFQDCWLDLNFVCLGFPPFKGHRILNALQLSK